MVRSHWPQDQPAAIERIAVVNKFAIAVAAALVAAPAFAQQVSLQTAKGTAVKCSDFEKAPDGSWTPVIDMIETGAAGKSQLTAHQSTIRPGETFSGVDIAAALTRQCHSK